MLDSEEALISELYDVDPDIIYFNSGIHFWYTFQQVYQT